MDFTGERFIPLSELLDDEIYFEHFHRYHASVELAKNKVVLDIACGEGYGSAILAATASKVFGVDIDPGSIEHAQKHYQKENIRFLQGSADQIPVEDSSIDLAVSYETLEHLDEATQEIFLGEIKRVLRPNGVLIISTPDKINYSERYSHKNEFHLKEFTGPEFQVFLEKHFKSIQSFLQGYEIVDAITPDTPDDTRAIGVSNWQRNTKPFSRKYLIAVCSNDLLEKEIPYASVVFQVNKNFLEITDSLIEKEKHILELGSWGKKLDKEADEKNSYILRLQNEVNMLKQQLQNNNDHQQDLNNVIAGQTENIHQLHLQAESLNKRLTTIYVSDGWKWLNRYYNFKGRLLPEHSGRYQFLKKTINKIRGKKGENMPAIPGAGTPASSGVLEISEEISFDPFEFSHFESPLVSIIIPVFNGWGMTYKCLASIKKNTVSIPFEIIIADDGATDETKNIEAYIRNLVVIRNETNLGFLNNCNQAAEKAKGKYILFLNNDTQVLPGWLPAMVQLMEKDSQIGMTGAKLIYPDGRLQEAGGIIWNDASGWNYGHSQDPQAAEFNYVKQVDYVSGAALLIRKELWEEIGGFDERYAPAYYEDTDLAFAVRAKGYSVVYQPLAEVVHFEGFSNGKDEKDGSSIKAYQEVNKNKFLAKWKSVLISEHFRNAENVFWARDRSAHKKTILVIDHYVPHYDQDAGSRHTYQYLKLLLDLNFNVKFIGDNFYKHEPYTQGLQQLGIEVLYGEHYRLHWKEWVRAQKDKLDYVLLHRPHVAIKYIDFFKEYSNAKIIYFGHDLHYFREEKQYEIEKTAALLNSSKDWKKTETYLFEKSDIILTPSTEELSIIQTLSNKFQVYTVPLLYFKSLIEPITDFTNRHHLLFVGGFNHKPNVDAVSWFAKEIFPVVKSRIPEIKFIVAGSNTPDEIVDLANDSILIKGFLSEHKLQELYASSRITVIPLRYGAGVKGKTIETMHLGVPFVSTTTGIEGLPGNLSFLEICDGAAEFAAKIVALYKDEEKLVKLSKQYSAYISENFTASVARANLSKILQAK